MADAMGTVHRRPQEPESERSDSQTVTWALVAGGICWAIVVIMVIAQTVSLTEGATGESGVTDELPWGPMLEQLAILLVMPLIPVLVLNVGRGRGFTRGYGLGLTSPTRFVVATAAAFLAMVLASLLSKLVQVGLGQQPWTGFSQTHEVTAGQRAVLAVFAGVTEEPLNVAIVVGVIYLSIRVWQVTRGRHSGELGRYDERQLWTRAVVWAVPVSLFLRFAGHMYQGWVLAAAAALWGGVLLLVFWWVRSVWPLMLAHVLHNMPMGIETWTQYGLWGVGLPATILAVGVLMLHRGRRGREAGRACPAR